MIEKREINNIVRIGNRDKREQYVYAILIRMSPHVYNEKENKCIIIQVRESLLEFAEAIIKKFKWAGLKEDSRKRQEYDVKADGGAYKLTDAYEIILKKVPILELMGEEESDD